MLEENVIEILIAEESRTQAEELKSALNRQGFAVSVVVDGMEALARIKARKPTIVISDIEMPRMDGYQLCREIKGDPELNDLPVILLTDLSDPKDVVRGLGCGADNFITKPFEEKYVHSRVRYVLENRHHRDVEDPGNAMELTLAGEKYYIKSDRSQILNLLLSSYEAAIHKNAELATARDELKVFSGQLEKKIKEKTAALALQIREHRIAERMIREQRRFLEKTIESLGHPFYVIDARDYSIKLANSACGFDGSPSGNTCYALTHKRETPCDDDSIGCPLKLIKETGQQVTVEHEHYDAEGNPKYVEVHGYPLMDDSGSLVRIIAYALDITERKKAEENRKKLEQQLQYAQRMESLATLVGGIAHDFNNIITAIIGFGSLMKMQMDKNDPRGSNLDQILNVAERAANLTSSLLSFGRRQELEPRRVNLNEIIHNVKTILTRLLREDIELITTLTDDELMVMVDAGQIQQILMNLATNARDAMPAGGRLTISTVSFEMDDEFMKVHGYGEPGSYALLMFSDSGQGIDEQSRQRIFEPFYTTKEVGKGTGLGLAVCYGIVKQHKGYINCCSEQGRGTTFRIYLPRIGAEQERQPDMPPPTGTETILLAEDDAQVRLITKVMLETFGYNVIEAADGKEAVARFSDQQDRIELAILDVIMPGRSGKEVYDAINLIRPGIKTMFTSGCPADVFDCGDMVDSDLIIISKPVLPAELLRKVRELLDNG